MRWWKAEGVWICGVCIEGVEPSSSMEVHASGGLEQDAEPPPKPTEIEGQEQIARRRARVEGFLTGQVPYS